MNFMQQNAAHAAAYSKSEKRASPRGAVDFAAAGAALIESDVKRVRREEFQFNQAAGGGEAQCPFPYV
jgi:hypothetical protein